MQSKKLRRVASDSLDHTACFCNVNPGSPTTPWNYYNKRGQRKLQGNTTQNRNAIRPNVLPARTRSIGYTRNSWKTQAQNTARLGKQSEDKKLALGGKSHLIVKGKPVPWSKTHEAFRDHLQNTQWAAHQDSDTRTKALENKCALRPQRVDEEKFTMEELQQAMAKLKPRKAPGPDHTANELFQLLDDESTQLLLDFYNKTWEVEEISE